MKEDKKKQDAYLEQVYKERLAEQEPQDDDDNMDWDPIEDMLEDSRGSFVGMLNFLCCELCSSAALELRTCLFGANDIRQTSSNISYG